MTLKREAYLAKCSEREKALREIIRKHIVALKFHKSVLTLDFCLTATEKKYRKEAIRNIKYYLNAYRHELARLKGMDRVVVPKVKFSVPQIREWGHTGRKSYYATCKCGNDTLYSGNDERYCPQCGRRILWEKVK